MRERLKKSRGWVALAATLGLMLGATPMTAVAVESNLISGTLQLPAEFTMGEDDELWLDLYVNSGWGWNYEDDVVVTSGDVVDGQAAFAFTRVDEGSEYRIYLSAHTDIPVADGYFVGNGSPLTSRSGSAAVLQAPAVNLVIAPVLASTISGTLTVPPIDGQEFGHSFEMWAVSLDGQSVSRWAYPESTETPGEYTFELLGVNPGEEFFIGLDDWEGNYVSGYHSATAGTVTTLDSASLVAASSTGTSVRAVAAGQISGKVNLPEGVSGHGVSIEAHFEHGDEWMLHRSTGIDGAGNFTVRGLDPGAEYALYVDDWRREIVSGYYISSEATFSDGPDATFAVGTSGLLLNPAATAGIRGVVELPAAIDSDNVELLLWEYDDYDDEWWDIRWSDVDEDGRFHFGDLDDGRDYRISLSAGDQPVVDGFYAGPGKPLAAFVTEGLSVRAPESGIVLKPESGTELRGTIKLPAGFLWEDDGWGNMISIYAREIVPGGAWVPSRYARVGQEDNGSFVFAGMRPGAMYTLEIYDSFGAIDGYYHYGAKGLVDSRDDATPVTPGTSVAIDASAFGVAPALSQVRAPGISGKAVVGQQLTVSPGQWSLSGVEVAFQWLRDGTLISGATGSTFTPTAADVGKRLSVLVTAVRSGYSAVQAVTVATAPVAFPTIVSTAVPTISGTARVGESLVATVGSWDQTGVSTAFQWLRDGSPIIGATGAKYALSGSDAGSRIAVQVTASKSGFADSVARSVATGVIAKGAAPQATAPPSVSGGMRFGTTLTANPGAWDVAGVTHSYQWLRNGKAIKGAASAKYKVTKADIGKRIAVRVTATALGRGVGLATSSAKKVSKAKPKVTAKAKAVKAGKRAKLAVTVKVGGVKKPTGKLTIKAGKKTLTVKLAAKRKGKVSVRLPKLAKGKHAVRVTFTPDKKSKAFLGKAKSKKVTLRVR